MMLRTFPSEKCTEIVVGEDPLDEEFGELKANLGFCEFVLESSYDAETSRGRILRPWRKLGSRRI